MPNLAGQKTFLQLQTEISEAVFSGNMAGANTVPSLTRLKAMINDSVREIMSTYDASIYEKEYTFNTVNGTAQYTLDPLAYEIIGMRIEAQFVPLQYLPIELFYKQYPGGYTNYGPALPWLYIPAAPDSVGAKQISLFPAPNGVYTIKYWAKTRFADMTNDTDIPAPIPPEWQDLIVKYTIMKILAQLGDPRANNWAQLYDARSKDYWLHNEHQLDYVYHQRQFYLERGASYMPNIDRALWLG